MCDSSHNLADALLTHCLRIECPCRVSRFGTLLNECHWVRSIELEGSDVGRNLARPGPS